MGGDSGLVLRPVDEVLGPGIRMGLHRATLRSPRLHIAALIISASQAVDHHSLLPWRPERPQEPSLLSFPPKIRDDPRKKLYRTARQPA
jgi:hypothetical protein